MSYKTNANQVVNIIDGAVPKAGTERIWEVQLDDAGLLAVQADGEVLKGSTPLATATDIAEMVTSATHNLIVYCADQQAYDAINPKVATAIYLVEVA